MVEPIQISRIEAGDLEPVRQLANQRLREKYNIELFQHFYETRPGCFLTAKEDGRVSGFILAIPMEEVSLRILMLVVSKSRERNGIGTSLMASAEAYASSRKMMTLVLEVGTVNESAIDFYSKIGFKITGMIPEYYNDKTNAFVMKKFLTM